MLKRLILLIFYLMWYPPFIILCIIIVLLSIPIGIIVWIIIGIDAVDTMEYIAYSLFDLNDKVNNYVKGE